MLHQSVKPSDWWLDQKSRSDRKATLPDSLYQRVQDVNLQRHVADRLTPEMDLFDLGYGIGYYTRMMVRHCRSACGIDPNSEYINLAKRHTPESSNVSFDCLEIGSAGSLATIADGSADVVFMSDALLFYFVSVDPSKKPDLDVPLSDGYRILRPGGLFACLRAAPFVLRSAPTGCTASTVYGPDELLRSKVQHDRSSRSTNPGNL